MGQSQRLAGMALGIALMLAGVVVFGLSVRQILLAFAPASAENEEGIALSTPLATATGALPTLPVLTTPSPFATATFAPMETSVPVITSTPLVTSVTIATATPEPTATATLVPPSSTPLLTATAPAATNTATIAATATTTPTIAVAATATIAPPPELTLAVAPLTGEQEGNATGNTNPCAALDSQAQPGLYQVETPARIGVQQRLCLGGYPTTGDVTVYLTGRSAITVGLTDGNNDGFGYAEVPYVPIRTDRNRALNMTAASGSVSASGVIAIEPVIPGNSISPQTGTSFATFYSVLTFPDATTRELFMYQRGEGDTFRYLRRILIVPQADSCAAYNPCFATDLTFSRESAGEYRFVEYTSAGEFSLYPNAETPLGFSVVNPDPNTPATATPAVTVTATIAAEAPTASATPADTLPTATPEPSATLMPSPTTLSTATPLPTVGATSTAIAPFTATPITALTDE